MDIDRELSALMAERVMAEPKACWYNAWAALMYEPELEGSTYVEGFVVTLDDDDASRFEHRWVELGGRIVDPTLWEKQLAYFPGLRIDSREQAHREAMRHPDDSFPMVVHRLTGDPGRADYITAAVASMELQTRLMERSAGWRSERGRR